MSLDELQALIDRLAPPAQKGRRRAHHVMVTLSDSERATLAAVASELHRPLAEVARGLALVAAAALGEEVGNSART